MTSHMIIAAVDLVHKDSDKRVIEEAIVLAGAHGATVEVVFVIPDHQNSFAQNYIPEDMREQVLIDARQELSAYVKQFEWGGVDHSTKVLRGVVYEELIERAEKHEARFVVIGAARPGLRDLFIGPNAARVSRHAPCSVLVVRPI